MSVLLTGGLGYIGSHIAIKLKKKAIIIDNNSNFNFEKKLPFSKVYRLDLNYKNLHKIFSRHSINEVIHLAGFKSVDESIYQPLNYYRNNTFSSLELLESMRDFNIKKLIFSSSATVYGNKHKSPLNENLDLNGTNPYARNKIFIEQMIKDYSDSCAKFKAIILRYFNPIGADIQNNLNEQPVGKPLNIMPVLMRSIKYKKKFKIFGNNYDTLDGTCIRDYIHVQDLADAHILALKKLSKTKGVESINLGLGRGISVLDFINLFEKTNKVKVDYKFVNRRKGDSSISYADNKKSKNFLKWKPKLSYKRMMSDSWHSYKNKLRND